MGYRFICVSRPLNCMLVLEPCIMSKDLHLIYMADLIIDFDCAGQFSRMAKNRFMMQYGDTTPTDLRSEVDKFAQAGYECAYLDLDMQIIPLGRYSTAFEVLLNLPLIMEE